jgi:hypothetical protein
VGNGAVSKIDPTGLKFDETGVSASVPALVEARHRNLQEALFDESNSEKVVDWWVGSYYHEVRKVGQAYEYQVYDRSIIWMIGLIPWGRNNELVHQGRVVIPGVMPEEVEVELWRLTFQGNLGTSARAVKDTGANIYCGMILVADIGLPGPEDIVRLAARNCGYELVKEGSEWILTSFGRRLHGAELDNAAAKVIEEVTSSRTKIGKFLEGDDVAEASAHAKEVGRVTGVVDRAGADARRAERMKGRPTVPGKDRDEYPPAAIKPDDPSKVSVKPIDSGHNRRSGRRLRDELPPDGTPVEIDP